MKKNVFIGLDLGATTLKAGAFNAETGECLALESRETALVTVKKDWAEYDPVEYRRMLSEAVRAVCGGIDVNLIGGIAVSSQGQACVLLDGDGNPARNMFVWLDSRATKQAAEFKQRTGESISSFASAAKWMWVADNEPEAWKHTDLIMMLPEYVTWLLSGERIVDRDTAASTGCLNKKKLGYQPECLEACGVTEDMLGKPVAPCEHIGVVKASASSEFGIPEGVPVIAGTNDQLAGALGAGNDTPGVISGTVGTAVAMIANLGAGLPHAAIDYPWRKYPVPGQNYALTFGKTGATILTWFRNQFAQGKDYSELIAVADAMPPGSEGLVCIPHFQGVATPSFRDDVRGAFLNVSMNHTFGHFARAVMEAVCFSALDSLELVRPSIDDPKRVLLLGGAAKSDVWMQMMCDVLDVKVELPVQSEAATLGAALMASVGAGFHADLHDAIRHCVKIGKSFKPDRDRHAMYVESYRAYRDFMEKLYPGAI